MTSTMRQVVHRRTGDPATVVEVAEVPVPGPGDGELLVRLEAAPINPAELLMFEGRYGYGVSRPRLPRRAGIEGVGVVVGGATDLVPPGTRVALLGVPGLWSDFMVVPAGAAFPLPADGDPLQQAMGLLNPQAVLMLLEDHRTLAPGDAVVQNAANSAFGRVLDAVGARRGLTVVNVVRSATAAASLGDRARGPVLVDGEDLADRVRAAVEGRPVRLAVDAVAGEATDRLARCLDADGVVALYGLLSGRPAVIDPALVVFHGVRLEGYWTPRSRAARTPEQRRRVLREAYEVFRSGAFVVPVEATYGLADVAEALRHAGRGGRTGKVLLTR
jgi:NADPH:quinone reductase-like Zn-dependent oxidoreductase